MSVKYVVDCLLPVDITPPSLNCTLGGITFDAKVHLQLEAPKGVKNLKFEDVSYPFQPHETLTNKLAYTKPFRILSEAGVKAARASMEEHISTLGKSTARASKYVRGLGYVSSFHRDLAYCPEILSLLSSVSDEPIYPHSMTMNISHTNIGEIATGKPVDKWHVDSVDYVLIIILSDLTDMVGGELRVLQHPNDKDGTFFNDLAQRGIPSHIPIETVNYIGAGYGLFMQGSRIFHTVNGVIAAREPRISLVNSYMSGRPFAEDLTRYNTFADGTDGKEISDVEYARHKAWRIRGQMQYILDKVNFTNSSATELSEMLFNASQELSHAAHLIRHEVNDNAHWIDSKPGTPTPGSARHTTTSGRGTGTGNQSPFNDYQMHTMALSPKRSGMHSVSPSTVTLSSQKMEKASPKLQLPTNITRYMSSSPLPVPTPLSPLVVIKQQDTFAIAMQNDDGNLDSDVVQSLSLSSHQEECEESKK